MRKRKYHPRHLKGKGRHYGGNAYERDFAMALLVGAIILLAVLLALAGGGVPR